MLHKNRNLVGFICHCTFNVWLTLDIKETFKHLNEYMLKMHSKCKVKELCLLCNFFILSEISKLLW